MPELENGDVGSLPAHPPQLDESARQRATASTLARVTIGDAQDQVADPGAGSSIRRRVLAHVDLGAEHILDLDGRLTGVIDWSDAAVTDPALDFARPVPRLRPELPC